MGRFEKVNLALESSSTRSTSRHVRHSDKGERETHQNLSHDCSMPDRKLSPFHGSWSSVMTSLPSLVVTASGSSVRVRERSVRMRERREGKKGEEGEKWRKERGENVHHS